MAHENLNDWVWIDLGEFVGGDVRRDALLGPEPFRMFTIRRKNGSPIHARGQFIRAEVDGTVVVTTNEPGEAGVIVEVSGAEVDGVFEGDQPVDLKRSA